MPDEYTVSVIEEEEALQFRLRGHLAKPTEPGHLLVGQELSDRSDPVPDDVYDEAAKHYDQQTLAAVILAIAYVNT